MEKSFKFSILLALISFGFFVSGCAMMIGRTVTLKSPGKINTKIAVNTLKKELTSVNYYAGGGGMGAGANFDEFIDDVVVGPDSFVIYPHFNHFVYTVRPNDHYFSPPLRIEYRFSDYEKLTVKEIDGEKIIEMGSKFGNLKFSGDKSDEEIDQVAKSILYLKDPKDIPLTAYLREKKQAKFEAELQKTDAKAIKEMRKFNKENGFPVDDENAWDGNQKGSGLLAMMALVNNSARGARAAQNGDVNGVTGALTSTRMGKIARGEEETDVVKELTSFSSEAAVGSSNPGKRSGQGSAGFGSGKAVTLPPQGQESIIKQLDSNLKAQAVTKPVPPAKGVAPGSTAASDTPRLAAAENGDSQDHACACKNYSAKMKVSLKTNWNNHGKGQTKSYDVVATVTNPTSEDLILYFVFFTKDQAPPKTILQYPENSNGVAKINAGETIGGFDGGDTSVNYCQICEVPRSEGEKPQDVKIAVFAFSAFSDTDNVCACQFGVIPGCAKKCSQSPVQK